MSTQNHLHSFIVNNIQYYYFNIKSYSKDVDKLPYTIKTILESAIRNFDNKNITEEHLQTILHWNSSSNQHSEIPFKPARILLHDTTGLPLLVDLAAMRDKARELNIKAERVNPKINVDLVVDHSVTVDHYGNKHSLQLNEQINFQRNYERFRFIRWAQQSFDKFNVIPPSTGIMHQINMEYLSSVVVKQKKDNKVILYPDTLLGTDSHTTMINGMGIVAWGVGGIEAQAAILGEPVYTTPPEVVGVYLEGALPESSTATDLALTITHVLRKKGVSGKFVEFIGPGLKSLSVADRATVANMAPEYGATMGYFPIDDNTIDYLELVGKSKEELDIIRTYYKSQDMFYDDQVEGPLYSNNIVIDLSKIQPSLAGPKRPQDRVEISQLEQSFINVARMPLIEGGYGLNTEKLQSSYPLSNKEEITHGSIVIAAITSCTNTSNPSVLITAGLLAKKAVELGLTVPSFVKTSLTPGSKVVTDYLEKSGLMEGLETLGFYIAGYGCATCIGNSGPLKTDVDKNIERNNLAVASVLSGNRNFEGRVHPQVKANYLASPPLVIAYALAGTVKIDLSHDALGYSSNNKPVYLKDIWPNQTDVDHFIKNYVKKRVLYI
ncbi:aconitate hydratase AcnA [Geomicrobium sp. JCM 19055]|uniref:aconitate hydratase AcnA n=1 Tax=Geomicrobium sp. JCM 19055 TaxID=1460649 RepID=UPI00045EDBF2|nr:aconitate hydratase [Geomicrobium sp. JCM 19055]